MLLTICLVTVLSSFGGVLLAISLKGFMVIKFGLEKGQRKIMKIGLMSIAAAVFVSIIGFIVNAK